LGPIDITPEICQVLGILAITVFLFVTNFVRVDVVAVLVLVMIGVARLLPPEQLFAGFSSEAVISMISIMIISAAMEKSGISILVAKWMLKVGRDQPFKISLLLMLTTGLLASFMRSLGTVALFLPIVTRITARTGMAKSKLLLPIAFCSILGGSLTMVGSGPLLILNSLLESAYDYVGDHDFAMFQPFELFAVFPVGLTLLFLGIVYLFLVARWLPKSDKKGFSSGSTKAHFIKTYNKGGDIFELRVSNKSPLINSTLQVMETKCGPELSILAISEGKALHFPPLRRIIVKGNSTVAIMGSREQVANFADKYALKLLPRLSTFAETLHPVRAGLCEAVIPPSSKFIGKEVGDLHMRRNHQLHVLALRRGDSVYTGEELKSLILRTGDTLGMYSLWEALTDFNKNPDFVVITTTYPKERTNSDKMPYTIFFFLLAILMVTWGNFSMSVSLLVGAVGMIASGVLTVDEAYSMVSWKTVFRLAGLIPLGIVMQETGTTDWLTQIWGLDREIWPTWVILSMLAVISSMFGLIITNIGATVLLVPVAVELSLNLGTDPRMFALTVALASSNTFVLPTHQANALIAGPGGYSLRHFFKIGGIMTIIYWIVILLAMHLMFR